MSTLLFVVFLIVGGMAVYRRLTGGGAAPALLVVVVLTALWAVAPWRDGVLWDEKPTLVRLIVVDVSESMGPDPDALFNRSDLDLPDEGRLIVVAAGHTPVVVFDGASDAFPDRIRPGVVPAAQAARARADVAGAIDLGLARLRSGESADAVIVSDGGFLSAAIEPGDRLSRVRLVEPPVPGAANLAVRIKGPPRTFLVGQSLQIGVAITGRLKTAASVELRVEAGAAAQRLVIPLEAGPVRHTRRIDTGPLAADARELVVTLVNPPADVRPADDRDSLPLEPAAGRPLYVVRRGAGTPPVPARLFGDADLSEDPDLIARADAVIVHNMPAAELAGELPRLRAAVEDGTGLLLAGSLSAFGLGGWDGQPIDALSPLKARPGTGKRVLAVALDASGSMETKDRFRRAADVVKATFRRLGAEDRLVLILFSGEIEEHVLRRADPSAEESLRRLLDGVRPAGGTDLAGALDRIAELKTAADEKDVLAIVLTDGRDERFCHADSVRRWQGTFRQRRFDVRVFWFDRDPVTEQFIRQLAARPEAVVEINDFGDLQRPFFQTVDESLVASGAAMRRKDSREVVVERLLRTRPDEEAEILCGGEDGLYGLARIRRGLGTVAAVPAELEAAEQGGVFGSGGCATFLKSLCQKREAQGELKLEARPGGARFVLKTDQPSEGPLALVAGDQRFPLARKGPVDYKSADFAAVLPGGAVRLEAADGQARGRLLYRGLGFRDAGPPPGQAAFAEGGSEEAAGRAAIDPAFLLLALLLLSAEIALRARGR